MVCGFSSLNIFSVTVGITGNRFVSCAFYVCRHAQDVRELYERKLERANNLYMELCACMLQMEKRERELAKLVRYTFIHSSRASDWLVTHYAIYILYTPCDLHNAGFHGRLPLFIEGFLNDRQFQVRLSAYYSQLFDQEMGVPQGSILLFYIVQSKISSVRKTISPAAECSFYVDDYLLSV